MPRTVDATTQSVIVEMILSGMPQRQICQETGISREFIRKLARKAGVSFPRNGYEIRGEICLCVTCGGVVRRSPSEIKKWKNLFCSLSCKGLFMSGENNPNYVDGSTAKSFSSWLYGQAGYREWKEAVLERDNHTCQVTGLTRADGVQLDAHHIRPKGSEDFQHLALDVSNGVTICSEAHTRIHQLIRKGFGYLAAIEEAKKQLKGDGAPSRSKS